MWQLSFRFLHVKKSLLLAGETAFETQVETFYTPNVSMSKEYGIGEWFLEDFYRAIKLGQSPEGKHYYPVIPECPVRI